jgi:hypothetical protein
MPMSNRRSKDEDQGRGSAVTEIPANIPPDHRVKVYEALARRTRRNRLAQFFSDALRHTSTAADALKLAQEAAELWETLHPHEAHDEAILHGIQIPPADSDEPTGAPSILATPTHMKTVGE